MTSNTKKIRWIPENAEELRPSDAPEHVVYLYTTKQGHPAAVAYQGKKNKPILNYAYQTEEQRLKHLNEQRAWWARDYKTHQAYKAEKSAPSELKPGDIVYCTWGYDQTNVDFYEVLSLTPSRKSATIQHLKFKNAEYNAYQMTGTAVPLPGQYNEPAGTFRTVGKDKVRTEHSKYAAHARKWDGCPVSYSWYG